MALGNALGAAGQVDAALRRYDGAVALWPAYSEAETNAGNLLFQSGKATEALLRYDRAIALRADNAEAHSNRGAALVRLGRLDEAVAALTEALRIDPRRSEAYNNLGIALQITVLREGHARNPSHAGMTARLAFLLATAPDRRLRDGRRARDLAEEAVRATSRRDAAALDALAAALAETGDTAQASRVAGEAERVAAASGQPDLAAAIRARRDGYDRGRPYRGDTVGGAVR